MPVEVLEKYTTIEYLSSASEVQTNIFIFVIDLCMSKEELAAVIDSIQQSINIIPPTTSIGLITYSRNVFVHEIGFTECPKLYAFKGEKEYTG